MSRNPFAHPEEPHREVEPARVSALAVAGFVCGLLCCIPGVGAVGAVLGGISLARIAGSEGRLTGRALGFAALLLGLLGTMFWIAVGVGGRQVLVQYDRELSRPAAQAVRGIETGDWSGLRTLLDPAVAARVTDEDLAKFAEALSVEYGPMTAPPQTVSFGDLFLRPRASVNIPGPNLLPLPIPVQFSKGPGMIVLLVDDPEVIQDILVSGGSATGRVQNFGVLGGARDLWLIDPGTTPGAP